MECGIGEYIGIAGLPTLTATYLSAVWAGLIVVLGESLDEEAILTAQRVGLLATLAMVPATIVLAILAVTKNLC